MIMFLLEIRLTNKLSLNCHFNRLPINYGAHKMGIYYNLLFGVYETLLWAEINLM